MARTTHADDPTLTADPTPPTTGGVPSPAARSHRGRAYVMTLVAVVLLAILIALAASNTGRVELHWLVGSGSASLVWIVLAATVLGWLLGLMTILVLRLRGRR
jgi:uncharacterized integral membrane protein